MRISMWTSYLMELTPEEMVTTLADHGWRYLEMSDEHGNALLAQGDPTEVGRRLCTFAADHGISFPQGHYMLTWGDYERAKTGDMRPADIASPDERDFRQHTDQMKRWVDLFNALGVQAGVLHAGGHLAVKAQWSAERVFDRKVQALRAVAEHAAGGPTTICLENIGSLPDVPDMVRLIEAVGMDNVAICLDTGHLNMVAGDCAAFVRQAGARLLALHIADNLGAKDDHMLPYGRGTVAWTPFMQALREIDYPGLFNYEVPGESRCPLPPRLAKLDYARRLAEWMVQHDGADPPT